MDQQQHLIDLFTQRQTIINELEGLQSQSSQKRELLLRVEGAIEYLNSIGVTLPEPEKTEEEGESSTEESSEDTSEV